MINNGTNVVFLDVIRTTGEAAKTQLRESLSEETVERYADAIRRGEVFPLVDLVEVGDGTYLIADGWHRVAAYSSIGRKSVRAIVHSTPDHSQALEVALQLALKANMTHGLHLTRGDQKKRAEVALLHSAYDGWSLRQLEAEIGVGKSTLGRVRSKLIKEGRLEHPVTGGAMPEWMPGEHASMFVLNHTFTDEDEMDLVFSYVRQLTPEVDPQDWTWDADYQEVTHEGLIVDAVVVFEIEDNPVIDGLPKEYVRIDPDSTSGDQEDDMEGPSWGDLSQPDRDRIMAANAKRKLHRTAERIKSRKDKELTRAVHTLLKRADDPGLWQDIRTLVLSGGPAEEHTDDPF